MGKFASNPRQYMYWLMNVATKTHDIVNVSCEIGIEKVRDFSVITSGTVNLTAIVTQYRLPGVVLFNAREDKFAYEATTTRYDCNLPKDLRTFFGTLSLIPFTLEMNKCVAGPPTIEHAELVEGACLKVQLEEEKRSESAMNKKSNVEKLKK